MGLMINSIELANEIALSRGGLCISKIYINPGTKLTWKCKYDHIWEASLLNVKYNKSWCPYCANTVVRDRDAVAEVIKSRGGVIISEYINSREKIKIKCGKGHIWETLFDTILGGAWCSHCSQNAKYNIEYCKNIAIDNEGECLSDLYKNSSTKMIWKCKKEHVWETTFGKIKSGAWCPYCYGNARHKIEDASAMAKLNEGVCLSDKYLNNNSKLLWKCSNGHIWENTYSAILRGSWCKECNVISNKQRKLGNLIREITGKSIVHNFKGFGWLKADDTGYNLEIDIWIPEIKLAIEYDGEQHFMIKRFGNISDMKAKTNFERTKKLDCIKNIKISQHPDDIHYFIRFDYRENMDKECIINKLIDVGLELDK